MRSLLIIASLALPTYLAYYVTQDPVQRSWAYYVLSGALVCAMADCIRRWAPKHVAYGMASASALLWWVEVESAQQAVCGAAQWASVAHADLCVQWFGPDVYRAVAAFAIAGLLTTWRPNRQP